MDVLVLDSTVSGADTVRGSGRIVYAATLCQMAVTFCDPEAQRTQDQPTRMIEQGSSLAISCGCDQVPDKALDVLIPSVVIETVHQDGSADGFNILLSELAFVASMGQDVCPAAPAGKQSVSMQMESGCRYDLSLTARPQYWKILDPHLHQELLEIGKQCRYGHKTPYRRNHQARSCMATEIPMWLMTLLGCWCLWLSFLGNACKSGGLEIIIHCAFFNYDLYVPMVTNLL